MDRADADPGDESPLLVDVTRIPLKDLLNPGDLNPGDLTPGDSVLDGSLRRLVADLASRTDVSAGFSNSVD